LREEKIVTTIEEFVATWLEAERTGDTGTTATLLTDDFIGIGPLGFQLLRAAWLGRFANGDLKYDELSLDEVSVREYPQSALVTARWNVRGTARGHSMPTTRATLALVQIEEKWKLAGIQYSFIAGASGSPGLPGGA
jgi:ketosteroid isomerase-like protein